MLRFMFPIHVYNMMEHLQTNKQTNKQKKKKVAIQELPNETQDQLLSCVPRVSLSPTKMVSTMFSRT